MKFGFSLFFSLLLLLFFLTNGVLSACIGNCDAALIEIFGTINFSSPFIVSVSSNSVPSINTVYFVNENNCGRIIEVQCSSVSQNISSNISTISKYTVIFTVSCALQQPGGGIDEETLTLLKFRLNLENNGCSMYKNFPLNVESTTNSSGIKFCMPSLKDGLLWPHTVSMTSATLPCDSFSKNFVSSSVATRVCLRNGSWKSSVDMTDCRLKSGYDGTMYIWLVMKDTNNLTQFETCALKSWVKYLMWQNSIYYTDLDLYTPPPVYSSNLPVQITVDLNQSANTYNNDTDFESLQLQILNMTQFSDAIIVDKGLYVFWKNDSCPCKKNDSSFILTTCIGVKTPPCQCTNNTCRCNSPSYIGDGITCTLDSDKDGYPDVPLNSCTYANSNQTYCVKDNCALVYNPSQTDNIDCSGCSPGVDKVWGLWWNYTQPGSTAVQYCPQSTTNFAVRYCTKLSIWSKPNLKHCSDNPWFFNTLLNETDTVVNSNSSLSSQFLELLYLYQELTDSYGETSSHYIRRMPHTLMNINKMIQTTLYFLKEHEKEKEVEGFDLDSLMMVSVFDDLLEEDNVNGWRELEEYDDVYGSTLLLENIERYGLLYAYTTKTSSHQRGNNLYIKSAQYDSNQSSGDVMLNSTLNDSTVSVCIPESILKDTIKSGSVDTIPVISIHFNNLEQFLYNNISSQYGIASKVWAGQIGEAKYFDYSLNITFSVSPIDTNTSKYLCSYWNTTAHDWSTDGVTTTVHSYQDYNEVYVTCSSYHLTAFTVLVAAASNTPNTPRHVHVALNTICYFGCVASAVCLLISIIFFASQYKELLEKTHMFIHLNLVIALFFAYSIFALGVELAVGNIIACTIVAAVMHYFFLASFCWMLCEGVMLYLLLVVVFTKHARKWYLFMILGWVTPLIPVALGVIIRYDEYITKDETGDIQLCWLTNKNGLMWALTGPMVLLISINIWFYCLIVWNLWKSKRMEKKNTTKSVSKTAQVISLLKGCFILLPLLGFTWLGGLLFIDSNTTVMASLFSIVNSLQGVAIFFLYVVRNDKVWSRLTACCSNRKRTMGKKTYSPTTSSGRLTSNRSSSLISNGSSYNDYNKRSSGSSTEQLADISGELTLSRLSLFKPDDMTSDDAV